MVKPKYSYLSSEQIDHWMEHGYIVIPGAIDPSYIAKFTADLWVRIGYDEHDKSTWEQERLHLPWHHSEHASVLAPNAWRAMCDLMRGTDKLEPLCEEWKDNFILNLGTPELTKENHPAPRDLDNWHVDGDWFRHFLDSPEQSLLMIALYSDINPGGGATYISPDGIRLIGKILLDHPEGLLSPKYPGGFRWSSVVPQCNEFIELTGKAGDVVILHPLMLHTASKNWKREVRIITNPPAVRKEPFNFNREDKDDFNLVELKTLKELGLDRVDYKITGKRERLVSPRVAITNKLLEEELQRLKLHSEKTGKPVDSMRLNTEVETVLW